MNGLLARFSTCVGLGLMLTAVLLSGAPATLRPKIVVNSPARALETPTGAAQPSRTAVPLTTVIPPPVVLPDTERTPSGTVVAQTTPAAGDPTEQDPVRIVIPSIHVDSPVVYVGWTTVMQGNQLVSEWDTADFAVGFHNASALPGTIGNTVMSGHNNINGEVFRYLDRVKAGDPITVYNRVGVALAYTVTQTMIVAEKYASPEQRLQNAQWIAPTEDNRLTLVSCWPYTNNTHRVIVVAKPS